MKLPEEIYIKKYLRILPQLKDKLNFLPWKAKKNRFGFWMFYADTNEGRIYALPEQASISENHLKVRFAYKQKKQAKDG